MELQYIFFWDYEDYVNNHTAGIIPVTRVINFNIVYNNYIGPSCVQLQDNRWPGC